MKSNTAKLDTVITELTTLMPRLRQPSQSRISTCIDLLKEVREAVQSIFEPAKLVNLMTRDDQRTMVALLLMEIGDDFATDAIVEHLQANGFPDDVIEAVANTS